MMRVLLPLLFLLFGVAGGMGAGWLLNGTSDVVQEGPAAEATSNPVDSEPLSDGSGATEYVRLNNQFVVPIVRHGTVRSLVVMALTLEVTSGENGLVFEQEPRLRDAFLQVLFAHANAGGFDGNFTQATAMAPLREALSEAAHDVLGETVHSVLIVDINRQDT